MSTTDIVTRLRGHIAITTRLAFAKDGFPEPVYIHGPSPICLEAADEIERLREQLRLANIDSFNTIADAEQLRAERDEARRRTNFILTEIDCRIEHGAESSGHLEVLRDMFKEKTDE